MNYSALFTRLVYLLFITLFTSSCANTTPTKWYVHIFNVDDTATAYINGTKITEIDFQQQDSGWLDVTTSFSNGSNTVRFTTFNKLAGYTWGFALKRDDAVVWEDVQGQAGYTGANNSDTTKTNRMVYDQTLSVSSNGQVSPQ